MGLFASEKGCQLWCCNRIYMRYIRKKCKIHVKSASISLSKPLVETMGGGERAINHVAMTIINPRREYWLSRRSSQKPSVLKPCTLTTEQDGLGVFKVGEIYTSIALHQEYHTNREHVYTFGPYIKNI